MSQISFKSYSDETYEKGFYENNLAVNVFTLGLCGESGEVAEKVKKLYRDENGEITSSFKNEVKKELGDVLWYINALAKELDFTLEEVAEANLEKIRSRKARGTQHGSGDNR